MKHLKLIFASSIASTAAVLFATAITIWAELSPPLKESLKNLTGHHWVTKSVGTMLVYILVFIIAYASRKELKTEAVRGSLNTLIGTSLLGTLALFAFFVWRYLASTM